VNAARKSTAYRIKKGPFLHPIPVPSGIMKQVGIDITNFPKNTYKLRNKDGVVLKKMYHGCNLKLFKAPDDKPTKSHYF
jgi:hypothetical protein